jgi:hypothetical protein
MTNKLVVIINSLKVPNIKKILLYEMKFRVPNYSLPPEPLTRGLTPTDPRSLCPLSSTEFVDPPPGKNSWLRHCPVPNLLELGGFQSLPGRFGDEKNPLLLPIFKPRIVQTSVTQTVFFADSHLHHCSRRYEG